MGNINDYLNWRGDLIIDSHNKFNEIDSLILARFSYLAFHKIEMEKKETIGSIAIKMKDVDLSNFIYEEDKKMIDILANCKRFKDMVVTDYERNIDKEVAKQFCAVTIHISKKEMYISFMGTDMSINGWKEDFNMSFMENVPCQLSGIEYTNKVCEKYRNKKVRMGGHSKGGNVAIYSSVLSPKDVQRRIIKVYNYDGPGFTKEFVLEHKDSIIIPKIETYIPQDSVVGRILNHSSKITIVKSLEKSLFQHDVFSWQVSRTDLVQLEENTNFSEKVEKALKDCLEKTTPEQRKIAVNALFDVFYSSGSETFREMIHNLKTTLPKILVKYNKLSKDDKKNITNLINIIVKSYLSSFNKRQKIKEINKNTSSN